MIAQTDLAGSFPLPGTSITVNRMGYGAMQLAGPGVWGPPRDVDAAIAVLHEAIESGVNHIDTSDYYGPHVTNRIIKQALHPYPDGLVIITKVGARRDRSERLDQESTNCYSTARTDGPNESGAPTAVTCSQLTM